MFNRTPALDLPGVARAHQKRSRETTAKLLRAGTELLRTRSLAEIPIEELCRAVGATVGAFYSRFESKEAYFNALQTLAVEDGKAGFSALAARLRQEPCDLETCCRRLVDQIVGWMQAHEGVVRAALQHTDTPPRRWTTFKELSRVFVSRATPLLLAAGDGRAGAARKRAIGFAFQVIFGAVVNAVLNDPGPLSLRDPEMACRLARLLQRELEEAGTSDVRPRRARPVPRRPRASLRRRTHAIAAK